MKKEVKNNLPKVGYIPLSVLKTICEVLEQFDSTNRTGLVTDTGYHFFVASKPIGGYHIKINLGGDVMIDKIHTEKNFSKINVTLRNNNPKNPFKMLKRILA